MLPRLAYYASELRRYRIWISVHLDALQWVEVTGFEDETLALENRGPTPLNAVQAYVAAYPGGVVVDREPRRLRQFPSGVRWQARIGPPVEHRLTLAEVLPGLSHVSIEFGPSPAWPNEPFYHSMTVRNVGDEPVRVLRFGGYAREHGTTFVLANNTDRFFTDDDFREWYAVPDDDGWVYPGEAVTDPTNWGEDDTLWALELETKHGERFFAGAVLE